MVSIVLALGAAVAWGVSDFMGGQFTRRLALAPVLLISQAVGFGLLLVLASLGGPFTLDAPTVGFAVAASVGGLIGIAALYRGMAVGTVSIVAPISATGAALPGHLRRVARRARHPLARGGHRTGVRRYRARIARSRRAP